MRLPMCVTMHVEEKKHHHYACTNIILSNWFLQMPADTSLVEEAEWDCSIIMEALAMDEYQDFTFSSTDFINPVL